MWDTVAQDLLKMRGTNWDGCEPINLPPYVYQAWGINTPESAE
jgi:hypothetical protein